jgi:pyruvate kinase
MRQTKIVATIGPASRSESVIAQLIHAGVDICRLNFSHGSLDAHLETCTRIREAAARAGRVVAILQDLGGPKIRTGRLKGERPVELKEGSLVRITTGDGEGDASQLYTTYAELARAVRPGTTLLVDDGHFELKVERSDGHEIVAKVVAGGLLGEHKGINAPGVELGARALTDKDLTDLQFGVKVGVDMVALSFVRSAQDVRQARSLLDDVGPPGTPIIAKLERPEALEHLDEIIEVSQGVMIARGDLGLEIPLEKVPTSQKEITRKARRAGVPVILATQVLESMRTEPRPTRAEVSDAANAVDDGVDAIMLAGETAVGVNPVRTVETLESILLEAERIGSVRAGRDTALVPAVEVPFTPHAQALCEAAMTLADHSSAYAIVAITRQGNTARVMAALRPQTPIVAATETDVVARHLTIYRGVVPLVTGIGKDIDTTGALVREELRRRRLVPPGRVVVFVSANMHLERPDANYVKVERFD